MLDNLLNAGTTNPSNPVGNNVSSWYSGRNFGGDDYTKWLEKLCYSILSEKNASKQAMIQKIRNNGCFDERYAEVFIEKMREQKNIQNK